MSDEPTTDSKPTGRASSAIWAAIKYGVLAYVIWYAAKWLGWVQEHCALGGEAGLEVTGPHVKGRDQVVTLHG